MSIGHDSVMILDTGYRVAYWSRGAEALYGWSATEAAGKDVRRLLKTRSPVAPGEVRRILSARGLWEGELENTRQDGSVVRVACRLALERKVRGRPASLLAIHTKADSHRGAGRPAREPDLAEGIWRESSAGLEEAEENLRRANERLEMAHQAAGAGTWDWDIQTGQLTWCDHLFRLFGLDPRTAIPSFETWRAILHPDDREAASSRIQLALEKHADLASEYRIIRPDGEVRWIEARGRGEYNRQGNPLRMIGICIDATDKHRVQKALEESERLYRAIGESIDYGVWVCAPDGRNTYASESFLKLVGLTQEQCSDFGWGDVLHPDDAERTIDAWKECVRTGGKWDIEHRFRGVDGRWHPMLARGVPVRDKQGEITCWAGINLDISSLKQAQEALETARLAAVNEKNRLEAVMQALPVGVAITDARGGRLRFNRMYESIWGGAPPAVESVRDYAAYQAWWADTVDPVQPEEWASAQAVQHGRTVIGQLMEIEKFDGGRRVILNSAAPILDAGGNATGSAVAVQDITELRRMEQALRASEERLRLAQTSAQVGVWDWDLQTGHLEFSPELCRLYGLNPGDIRVYEDWRQWVHPDDFARVDSDWREAVAAHEPFDLEFRILHTAGGIRWISAKGGALYDAEGGIKRIFGVNVDITARKLAEAALRESESRYRTLFNCMSEGFALHEFICDDCGVPIDYRFLDVNPAFERLTGMLRADVVGRTVRELLPGEYRQWVQAYGELVLTGKPVHFESYSPALRRHFELSAYSNAPCQFAVIFIDITDRKQMQAELLEIERLRVLSESRKLWQDTFDAITDLISIHDPDGSLRHANRAFLEYFGLPEGEAAGRKYHELFPEEGYPAGGSPLERCLAAITPVSGEFNDAQRSRIFEIYTFPLGSGMEAASGCIQVTKDITDRRESELRLIVSERLAAVGQLAAGVAHEINNPLATISGCAEGLLSRIDQKYDPAGTREYLEIIREEVFRCKTITDGMLSFVRQSSYELRPVSVNDALDKDIEMMRLQGRLHNVQVQRQYAASLPPVRVREGDLRQVFLALLANALDAMDDRGILTLRTGLEAGHVFAVIEDTGPGVAPEQRDRIFDLFFTTKAQKGGTGIGLPVARKLVRGMSGQVTLETGAGPGAAFRVSLPVD